MLMSYTYQKQLDEAVEKAVKEAVNEITEKFLKTIIRLLVAEGHDFEYIFGFTQSEPHFKVYPFETIKTLYDEIVESK